MVAYEVTAFHVRNSCGDILQMHLLLLMVAVTPD